MQGKQPVEWSMCHSYRSPCDCQLVQPLLFANCDFASLVSSGEKSILTTLSIPPRNVYDSGCTSQHCLQVVDMVCDQSRAHGVWAVFCSHVEPRDCSLCLFAVTSQKLNGGLQGQWETK